MARTNWLDESGQSTLIDDYAQKLTAFVDAIADGQIDSDEVARQEKRVVALIKEVEPQLDDALHAKITELLCELTAFNAMQLIHGLCESRPLSKFRG